MCPFKTREVDFLPASQETYDILSTPAPAKNFTPEWLKAIPNLPHPYDDNPKRCVPFMDALNHGYIQELTCDVKVRCTGKDQEGNDIVEFIYPFELIEPLGSKRDKGGKKNLLPKFPGYYRSEQHWNSIWEPHTPKGFSTLYCHPLNRLDLPFTTLAGIIDTDVYPIPGPIPFLVKEGFEGLIPAGTPIYQIIFVKRENWKSKKGKFDSSFLSKTVFAVKRYFSGGYKRTFWTKKSFD